MKQYLARLDLGDEDEVVVLEADSLEELAELMAEWVLVWGQALLSVEDHRLYKLIAACEHIKGLGEATLEACTRLTSDPRLPALLPLEIYDWEIHEPGAES